MLARRHFGTGRALYEQGRIAEALEEFRSAQAQLASPAFDFNIGKCLEWLARPAEAAESYERFVRARPDDEETPGLWRRIGELRAMAKPSPIAPTQLTSVDQARGAQRTVRVRAAVGLGVIGGSLLLVGAGLGGASLAERARYDRDCNTGPCAI